MTRASGLPAPTTSFVGRERELREGVERVGARRLVTLTGVGGGGKTRLALEIAARVADRHRDGVCLVELAGLRDGALVPEAVLAALGMREPAVGRTPSELLCASLAHRELLLVLDNCEHVVEEAAALVAALLPSCPGLRVLATSREPLRLPGEVERSVAPLERPDADASIPPDRLLAYDAVRLLVERGSDVREDFRIGDENVAAIAQISAALDGIPLAIELVAARLRTLSLGQVAAQLGEQMALLRWEGRGRPDRQQTMRATLDWSHALLTEVEQRVFRRLSIFAGGFTLDAAEEIAGAPAAREIVEALVAKSLVEVDHASEEPRLRMLEPVRQYAAEKLRDPSEREEVIHRHVQWVVRFAKQAGRGFAREQRVWRARLREEENNIRRALEADLDRSDGGAALHIAASLGQPWNAIGQPDARAWTARALGTNAEVPARVRGMALLGAGLLAEDALDFDGALAHLREALPIARQIGARNLEGWVLALMGRASWWIDVEGRPPAAWFEDALGVFRTTGESVGIGRMLDWLAEESFNAGDDERATTRAQEAIEIGAETGVLDLSADPRLILSKIAARRGEYTEAERILEEIAEAYAQEGDRWALGHVLWFQAQVALDRGDPRRGLVLARDSLHLAREIASGERILQAIELSVRALGEVGREAEAATLLGAWEASTSHPSAKGRAPWSRGHAKVLASMASAEFDAHRATGSKLSLEQAAELAFRALGAELAAGEPGSSDARSPVDSSGIDEPIHVFRRDGDLWTITYAGKEIRLRDLRGLHYLATLLREPGREFHATDLVRSGHGPSFAPPIDDTLAVAHGTGDAGERLDARARTAYRARIDALDDAIAEAERLNDLGRLEHARDEREALLAELGAAARGKRASSDAERARLTATKGIKAALDKIAASHPELGAHLHATVRRGYFCAYVPDPRHPIEWEP